MPSRDKFVVNGGVKIHYEIDGTGTAVVMRTGAGGDCRIWKDAGYVAGLPNYRKILIDQRGRGRSDRPSTIESHSIELHVSDICAVLDDVGAESAAYMGYSAGAALGLAFGALHPNRLEALVGIGSLPMVNYADRPRPSDMAAEIQRIVAAGGVRAEYEAFVREDHDRFPDPIHNNVLGGDPLMRALDAAASYSTTWRGPLDAYPTMEEPVLMLSGEKEDTERDTEKAVSLMPRARVVRLPGIGHLSTFYRSDLTLPHIIPFFKENLG
ncbi:MAG TPA: alpha/beta hydrolase [Nitrososphaerales archaeon]|nr:alpha/beta hydrolase [Nitrososphaerales archaeon]